MRAVAWLSLAPVLIAACDRDSTPAAATCSEQGGMMCTAAEDCNDSWIEAAATDETEVWIEKLTADDGELYVFFKPFELRLGERFGFDGQTVAYDLELATKPVTARLTDAYGNTETVSPNQTLTLDAENEPKYLEVRYR